MVWRSLSSTHPWEGAEWMLLRGRRRGSRSEDSGRCGEGPGRGERYVTALTTVSGCRFLVALVWTQRAQPDRNWSEMKD